MDEDPILRVCEAQDVVFCVTGNTKLREALDRVFSRAKGANVGLFADSKGIQKLVSLAGLINDSQKDNQDKASASSSTLNQLNFYKEGKLYIYFDFSNNSSKQMDLIQAGWVRNESLD